MIRLLAPFLAFLALATPGHAQQKPPPQAQIPALTQEQARAALEVLNDPKKRAAFAATLEALSRGQPPAAAPEPPPPPEAEKPEKPTTESAVRLDPDSLGAEVLLAASRFVNETARQVMEMGRTVQSLPLLWGWLVVMATNPLGRQILLDASWRVAVVMAIAVAAGHGAGHLVRGPMRGVLARGRRYHHPDHPPEDPEARAEQGEIEGPAGLSAAGPFERRLGLGLARLALRLVPVLALMLAGHAAIATPLGGGESSQLIALAVLHSVALTQAALAFATFLLEPDPPGLRLFALPPASGRWLMTWLRRLIIVAIFGYAIGEVGLLMGLSDPAHEAVQETVGLILRVILGIMIVRRRRSVRLWLSAPRDATGTLNRMRNAVAHYWAAIALFALAVSWLNWAAQVPHMTGTTLWYCGITVLMVVASALARTMVHALIEHIRPGDPDDSAYPVLTRLSAYRGLLSWTAGVAINLLALLMLLQFYGLGALTWLVTSEVGRRILSGLGTIATTIGVAFLVWELANIAILRHVDGLRRDQQGARLARTRTLLPLLRTTLGITVAVVAGLMVLSEIGLNIGPLLAGAGIIGVAIGFGSQKLVQDVITGVFLLLENTIQVGDVVRVGDQAGLVESLSVRTVRLRTEDGSVVVMPFSAVTTVINMTRDYSQAVLAVNVAYTSDIDQVAESMRDIVREMRAAPPFNSLILDEAEIFGMDKFGDSSLLIKGRVRCTPFGRWQVGREFNRRVKTKFEELGIEMPYPHLKLVLDGDILTGGVALPPHGADRDEAPAAR